MNNSLKIRTMNFSLDMNLTLNSSWFRLYKTKINNLKSKWSTEIAQEQVPNTTLIDGRDICFLKKKNYKILPDCNPKDEQNSHYIKILRAYSKNRKMNFHLEIKLTVNSSWFQLCEPRINTLKSKWSRELAHAQVPTTDLINGREICFLK